EFAAACRHKRTSKSALVTELIRGYLAAKAPARSPFELAEAMGLVGCQQRAAAAGRDHSRYIKEKLRGNPRGAPRERRAR
ncbi:MAG: hypothetical protein HYU75_20065, partial [Betaproteobacteria bacterium]|nr:hypothetical protein [Betaproteobacteria bacterium]